MKKAKNLLLISVGVIFIGMIILYSCRSYTGPAKKVDGDKLDNNLDSGSEEEDYFDTINNCIIPALTVTKNNTLIAAIGDKNNAGKILIKTSKDGGTNWSACNGNIKNDYIDTGFAHPFFINCYDGSILLGIATTNETENIVSFYRSTTEGASWNKESAKIEMPTSAQSENNNIGKLTPQHAFATYGNGLALRHNGNANTLLFPYYYIASTGSGVISTMISTDNGASWKAYGKDQGPYASYGAKFIEIENGNILYFLNGKDRKIAWFSSKNKGQSSSLTKAFFKSSLGDPMYADFVRYEFNGKDISNKSKHVLVAFSEDTTGYKVMMSTDDFKEGTNGTKIVGEKAKTVGTSSEYHDVYPAITVLRDGTICTLAAENYDIIFRSFGLSFLEGKDTKTYSKKLW
ncbi:exo-alpha-sialidase [Brachyspira aalborgi]|uniref:Exo-alpha-sialidase n=1 Tax=Brachyspira aalborgi TaxID=29522 RepID=A0A5C8F5G9_9SPIR|nr:sialidase family protein [Brachyspira aalborgi]TXJ44888.1 exo-alpha-sialidase [Brachyspira aalborgi]